ncbi:rhodanese-like domain-containing protein [Kordia sp. YSTF-M3]|uniref:Rhodanese-like domain-containing protein n=1 Tax=Kordia aestuariivivens TaxID=2759037 RepID=A0ABR7Q503_9FLAO|nr:rhodanese-like domain-containing protein [Kordia aestuariivivens]MBC8753641.1 rhodanese-like domain-containing protein [Kordia aestuariivivens]
MKLQKITFVFIALTFLVFFSCSNAPKENNITVTELYELLKDAEVTVLDVRTPEEVAEGKITGKALEANFYDDTFVADVTSKIAKDQTIYVYCKSGRRSGKTVVTLRELGYSKTYNVEGGIKAWKAAGYEIE